MEDADSDAAMVDYGTDFSDDVDPNFDARACMSTTRIQCGDQFFRANCAISGPPSSQFRCRGPKGRGSRCEAARAAIRSGGQVRQDVLKCTVAPGLGRKQRGPVWQPEVVNGHSS